MPNYKFDLGKCREIHTKDFEDAQKITVHTNDSPEMTYNGIAIMKQGQWDEDALLKVQEIVSPDPIVVRFGSISSTRCYVEV